MEGYESILTFNNYIVNEIIYKANSEFRETKEQIPVDVSLKTNIKQEEDKMEVNLILTVNENAIEKNFPYEMKIDITGYFSYKGETNEKIDLRPNAIAILYPYLRAIVSTYTVSANKIPLILPAINTNKLIRKEDKQEKD